MKSTSAIKLSNSYDPYEISDGKHVMLMYNNQEDREKAAAYWVIHGIDEGAVGIMLLFMHWISRNHWV